MGTTNFSYAQTFTIDPGLVQNASQVLISSVSLFCESRPSPVNNGSGVNYPGVKLYIVPVQNKLPVVSVPVNANFIAYCDYDAIIPSIDASMTTDFKFNQLVPVSTGVPYAILFVADGYADFVFWTAVTGQTNLTTGATITSIPYRGQYFELSSDSSASWTPLAGTELTFSLSIARYFNNGTPVTNVDSKFTFFLGHHEFVDYDTYSSTGNFLTGEPVFIDKVASPDGTCSVVAGNSFVYLNGGQFSDYYSGNDVNMFIASYGNGMYDVRKLTTFSNNYATASQAFSGTNSVAGYIATSPVASIYVRMPSENRYTKSSVALYQSTANSSVFFSNNINLRGAISNAQLVNCIFDNIIVYDINPQVNLNPIFGSSFTAQEDLNYTTMDGFGTTFVSSNDTFPVQMFNDNLIPGITVIPSWSTEAETFNFSSSQLSNSSDLEITFVSENDYTAPSTNFNTSFPVYFTRYYINNSYWLENTMNGNAVSKEVSTTVSLASGSFAEDVLTWIQGYRPPGTDLKCFVKFYNSTVDPDEFQDKDWTLLQINANANTYSSSGNSSSIYEYGYIMGNCPNTDFTFSGTMNWPSGFTNVTSSTTSFSTGVSVGDLVKIYSPLFPNTNFMVVSVAAIVNSSVITVDQITTNNSIWGSGLMMDHIGYPKQAFLNNQNYNVVRYYDSNYAYHDTYDTFAVKVVFLSSTLTVIPFMTSVRSVAVSS